MYCFFCCDFYSRRFFSRNIIESWFYGSMVDASLVMVRQAHHDLLVVILSLSKDGSACHGSTSSP